MSPNLTHGHGLTHFQKPSSISKLPGGCVEANPGQPKWPCEKNTPRGPEVELQNSKSCEDVYSVRICGPIRPSAYLQSSLSSPGAGQGLNLSSAPKVYLQ